MRSLIMLALIGVIVFFAGSLHADLLVYEGFDYTPVDDPIDGAVNGKNGGTGFGGPWIDSTVGSNGGEAFVYDSAGNIYSGLQHPGLPDWDGVVDNLPQTGGYAGLSGFIGNYDDRMNCSRTLASSAGDMAGADGVLWASMAVHYVDTFGAGGVGFAFTDGSEFVERARQLSDSGSGIGLGNGTSSLWGNDIDTTFWAGGVEVAGDHITNVSRTQDNVVVIKFEFGATDTVSAWYFTEDQEMTEAAFIANAAGTTSTIDEFTLTTLAIGYIRAANAFDEIRIGDTFNDVIGYVDPTLATVDAGSNWTTWSGEPVQLDDVTVVNNDLIAGDLNLGWTAIAPAGVSVSFSDNSISQPEITVTKSADDSVAVVNCTLTVTQTGKDAVESAMRIYVYDDACKASVGLGSHVINSSDLNADCVTNFEDMLELANGWLVDFALTSAVDK